MKLCTELSLAPLKAVYVIFFFSLALIACDSSSEEGIPEDPLTAPQSCSGSGVTECAIGEFCRFPDGTCGALGEPGTCEVAPEICTLDVQPVCACDGLTYSNACQALGNGASLFSNTSCDNIVQGSGQLCGGGADLPCVSGFFCEFEVGSCGGLNSFGICREVPFNCPLTSDFVCGCDGNTYQNGCLASAAGTTIRFFGSCQ